MPVKNGGNMPITEKDLIRSEIRQKQNKVLELEVLIIEAKKELAEAQRNLRYLNGED